ncbi:hypothetical protein FH966_00155 [Lentibacillus cibarius]|uniref:ATPase n=1 Tax=Lentibacillus cibarius TaxID=2583219 RepID=A0A549YED7_9BACI|nr:hypothetical protein [Lentibacillus cibarius]TMN21374.1 hypothetical protein FFL34_04070 [Lentibacillus cibarius]TRM10253.1 hypothetical protein FH966_00155 [Lentibacillus cibarius]
MSHLHYYVTGNTAEGLVNHLDTNLTGIDKVIVLRHPSAKLKTAVFRGIMDRYANYNLEVLQSSFGNDYLDGIIIRNQSLAFIDESIAEANSTTIDLSDTFPASATARPNVDDLMQQAYDSFAEGLRIHDGLEEVFINQMDFNRANSFADDFIADLLKNVPKKQREPRRYHRLFGTNTADGVVNVVPHLIENIKHVYYIKGRAGTGKSVLMKKIANACLDYGFDIELYYCSFDPNSVDMVLVRDLDFCIFDSTDPHEFFPKRDGEEIIDMYEKFVAPGTDEAYATQINDLNKRYKACMKKGIQYLKEAGSYQNRWEDDYMKNITNDAITKLVQSL